MILKNRTARKFKYTLASSIVGLCWLPNAFSEPQLLWGDTHLHSSNSPDAYLNGNMSASPDTAYRFAKGLAVIHPGHRALVQINTPLDFLVVADHAEYLGVVGYALEKGAPREELGVFERLVAPIAEWLVGKALDNSEGLAIFKRFLPSSNDVLGEAATPRAMRIPGGNVMMRTTWNEAIKTADAHNDPGKFSTLIGWEWSSMPGGANLHRVVFTSADATVASKFFPYSAMDSNYPEDLWQWLDKTAAETGADFVAIPHNANISKGFMFPAEKRLRGTPIDAQWVKLRAKWETVAEATQIKGDSETHPTLSPDDPFADFEEYPHYIQLDAPPYAPKAGDFVRAALKTGLAIEEKIGFNPYHFGLIGSTDAHTGLATAEEPNFWGKMARDSIPENKAGLFGDGNVPTGWSMSASGLAAVWAKENTRDAILAAFKRREVYATTGPRITVRVVAGPNIESESQQSLNFDELESVGNVPMGGELSGLGLTAPPRLLIYAMKDPKSAHLDRMQVVKGWIKDGVTHERVYDVAWAGERSIDEKGRIQAVPDTVDPKSARYSNDYGSPVLSTLWIDPDFKSDIRAFYYVRVLEIPTPRHSLRDAIALGIDPTLTGKSVSIQERAYTSPIHYRP